MTINIDLLKFFDKKEIERIAREKKFVMRASPIDGFNMLLTFTTGLLETTDTTLLKLVIFLNNTSNINVTPQSLDERINKYAVDFLKTCLEKIMNFSINKRNIDNNISSSFNHIYITDSTNFSLHPNLKEKFKGAGGGASSSSVRIQLIYDYLYGKMYLEIGDIRTVDQITLENAIKYNKLVSIDNALFIQDLGYFKYNTFTLISNKNGFFISKLKYGINIYDTKGNKINLKEKMNNKYEEIDMKIVILGKEYRVVGKKLSEQIVNERIRKAKETAKKNGTTITKEKKLFLSWIFYITNLPKNFPLKHLHVLYRIRWQIELIFKAWKSILKINKINTQRDHRVLCEVYGKLIIAILINNFFHLIRDGFIKNYSYFKLMQYFNIIAILWAKNIYNGIIDHRDFLKNQMKLIKRLCVKNQQKNKPTIEYLIACCNSLMNNCLA